MCCVQVLASIFSSLENYHLMEEFHKTNLEKMAEAKAAVQVCSVAHNLPLPANFIYLGDQLSSADMCQQGSVEVKTDTHTVAYSTVCAAWYSLHKLWSPWFWNHTYFLMQAQQTTLHAKLYCSKLKAERASLMEPEPATALPMAELSLSTSRQDSHLQTFGPNPNQPQSLVTDQAEPFRASSGPELNANSVKKKSSIQVGKSSSSATSKSTSVAEKPRRVSNLRKTTSHKRVHNVQNVPTLAVSVFIMLLSMAVTCHLQTYIFSQSYKSSWILQSFKVFYHCRHTKLAYTAGTNSTLRAYLLPCR